MNGERGCARHAADTPPDMKGVGYFLPFALPFTLTFVTDEPPG